MTTLIDVIPNVDVLLVLAPEELGRVLLKLVKANLHNDIYYPDSALSVTVGTGMMASQDLAYPANKQSQIDIAVAEGWQWLRINMLIVPAPGINGQNGHVALSRRGMALASNDSAFDSYKQAASFPKDLLHPTIADHVWIELARGNLDEAVFHAFKMVEVAVRQSAQLRPEDVGTSLMRKAFHPENGPLTNMELPPAEREALMSLFAGAIGSYKNPHSHRTVSLSDPREAQEMLMLASHLLRIVDARSAVSVHSSS